MYYLKFDIDQFPVIRFAHTFLTDNYGFTNRIDDSTEIVYIQKGIWTIDIKGFVSFEAGPGEIAVLPPNTPYSVSIRNQGVIHEHSCINFSLGQPVEIIDDIMLQEYSYLLAAEKSGHLKSRIILLPLYSTNASEYESLMNDMVSEYSLMKPVYRLAALGQLISLLSRLTRRSLETVFAMQAETSVSPINHVYCRKIIGYLDRHFSEKVSIKEISKEVGLNPHYMCNLFKITTGDTIVNFLNRMRIEKSKEMLIKSDCKISEICSLMGFENEQYFSRVFRKHQGIAPGKFRMISLNNLNNKKYLILTNTP